MERQKEKMVLRGMSNVHSGLGILLGVGCVSSKSYDQILALLMSEMDDSPESDTASIPRATSKSQNPELGKKPLVWRSDAADPNHVGSLIDFINGSKTPREESSTHDGSGAPPTGSRQSNIVCPYHITSGYRHYCADHDGSCPWIHDNIADGIKQPLICSFWAENRCNKSSEQCRFAHYWAQHGQVAPAPASNHNKARRTAASERASRSGGEEAHKTTRRTVSDDVSAATATEDAAPPFIIQIDDQAEGSVE